MTSLINNSNSNSALINTINSSQSKHNPNVYSTKKIYPAAATTYVKTKKSSGSVSANQTITFDLMKYGIAQQILLVYKKTSTNDFQVPQYDLLNVIDRIELLSSSKVIDTLTKYDLLSQFSNLESSQYNIVNKSCLASRGTAAKEHLFVVPLVFGFFKDINTNLNLQFNEPMSIRIRWGPTFATGDNGSGTLISGVSLDADYVYLKMRYKAYNESDFSEILAQNYNEPELNQLSSGFYNENTAVGELPVPTSAGISALPLTGKGVPVELKNTDCVNDFYVTVIRNAQPTAPATKAPVKINRIRMTASGQEIFDLEEEELFYSKLCENGFSILTSAEAASVTPIINIQKIQTGLWEYAGGGTQSNTLSLRELNNPIIEVWFEDSYTAAEIAAAATSGPLKYDVIVTEDAVKIYSTTSSTGRVQTALSN